MTTQDKIKENHSQEESPGTFGNPGSQEGWKSKPSRSNPALDIKKEIKEVEKEIEDKRLDVNMIYTDEEFKQKLEGQGVDFLEDLFSRFRKFMITITELEIKKATLKTLKSCSSENEMLIKGQENLEKEKQELANKIEFLIKQYKEEITKLQEEIENLKLITGKSLKSNKEWMQGYNKLEEDSKVLWSRNTELNKLKAEQKAKVEKLKEGIAEKCSLKTQNRLFILIDKIFSPEEADLQEEK